MGTPLAARLWELLTGVDGSAPSGWTRPRPDRDGFRRDAFVGAAVALVIAGAHWTIVGSGIFSATEDLDADQPLWMRVLAPLAFGVVVAVRRALPITALLAGTAVFFGFLALGYLELFLTPYVYFYILYSAGAWSSRRTLVAVLRALITAVVVVTSTVNLMTLNAGTAQSLNLDAPGQFGIWASLITLLFYLGAIWLGNSEYLRAGQRATMDAQVAQLRASRAQLADQAVRLDRLRIARELHDSVAHHVSLMGVQAAVARRTLEVGAPAQSTPPTVVAALERVETSARDAVSELQSVLVTLRSEDEDGTTAHPLCDLDWHGDAVSVQQDGGAGEAAVQDRDDRGERVTRRDLQRQTLERRKHALLRPGQVVAQLRIGVQLAPQGDEVVGQCLRLTGEVDGHGMRS